MHTDVSAGYIGSHLSAPFVFFFPLNVKKMSRTWVMVPSEVNWASAMLHAGPPQRGCRRRSGTLAGTWHDKPTSMGSWS